MENTRNSKKYEYVRKTFTWDGKRYDVKGKTIEEVYKKIAKMKVSLERGEIVINANTTIADTTSTQLRCYSAKSETLQPTG